MANIVIIGASGHAKVAIDIIESQATFRIAGLLDRADASATGVFDYQVLGSEEELPDLVVKHQLRGALIAIADNAIRSRVADRVSAVCPELPFITAIHPAATIGRNVQIGAGTLIMAGVVINPSATIGRFCILNTNSSLDHDSVMEDFASLAPGVRTGGNCRIGCHSAIGIGAILRHGISIGNHTVIGAGSLVLDSIEPGVVAYGSPARVVRTRIPGERYL